jgi:hypothetical protein
MTANPSISFTVFALSVASLFPAGEGRAGRPCNPTKEGDCPEPVVNGWGETTTALLRDLHARRGAAFISQCESPHRPGQHPAYRALLLFEVGKTQGLLIQLKDGAEWNFSDVVLSEEVVTRIVGSRGAPQPRDVGKAMASVLTVAEFKLWKAHELWRLTDSKPSQRCEPPWSPGSDRPGR